MSKATLLQRKKLEIPSQSLNSNSIEEINEVIVNDEITIEPSVTSKIEVGKGKYEGW
jgi:hypothetical protein